MTRTFNVWKIGDSSTAERIKAKSHYAAAKKFAKKHNCVVADVRCIMWVDRTEEAKR